MEEDEDNPEVSDFTEKDENADELEIPGGVEIVGEHSKYPGEDEESGEAEGYEEGALLGKDDRDSYSSSSSEMGSEESDEGDEEEIEEEEQRHRHRRRHRKSVKFGGEVEEEEEEVLLKRDEEEEVVPQPRRESKGMPIRTIISGFELDMGDDEGEEESTETSESEPTPLEREPYYTIYLQHIVQYAALRRLNNFLHKKMSEYFKKRKMEHVLREMAEHLEEARMKYGKKLDNFYELIELDQSQREAVNAELKVMKQMRERQVTNAQNFFKEFIALERDTGIGLINSKTGKEISDKIVDKLLNNQKSKAKEIQNLRLMHFKVRNAVADKHASIRALDKIGENYTLIEYEQMKIENQAHMDKMEERDDELTKLRKKCSAAIQCLAHVREKCSAVEINIRTMKNKLDDKDLERAEARERMNELKVKRDYYRREVQRLKQENGLLTKDKLLIDMEDSINENNRIEELLELRTKRFLRKKERLAILKENYDAERNKRKIKSDHMKNMKSTSGHPSRRRLTFSKIISAKK